MNSSKLDKISNTIVKYYNSYHDLFYLACDKDFVDQEQSELLFHAWNLQTNMFFVTKPPRGILANDSTTLILCKHLTIKIPENRKIVFL